MQNILSRVIPPFFHASLTAVMFQLIQLDSAQPSLYLPSGEVEGTAVTVGRSSLSCRQLVRNMVKYGCFGEGQMHEKDIRERISEGESI